MDNEVAWNRGSCRSSHRDVTGLNRAQNKLKGRDGEREKGEINIEIWSRRRVGLNIEISLVNWKYVGRDQEKVRLLQTNLALKSRVTSEMETEPLSFGEKL